MAVKLSFESPFQLLNSTALILVVEFHTQGWGWDGLFSLYSSNRERRGSLRERERAVPSLGTDL